MTEAISDASADRGRARVLPVCGPRRASLRSGSKAWQFSFFWAATLDRGVGAVWRHLRLASHCREGRCSPRWPSERR